jgi:hypothetical protein
MTSSDQCLVPPFQGAFVQLEPPATTSISPRVPTHCPAMDCGRDGRSFHLEFASEVCASTHMNDPPAKTTIARITVSRMLVLSWHPDVTVGGLIGEIRAGTRTSHSWNLVISLPDTCATK